MSFLRLWFLSMAGGLIVASLPGQVFNSRFDLVGTTGNSGTAWSVETTLSGDCIVFCNGNYADTLSYSSVVRGLHIGLSGSLLGESRVSDPYHATYPGWSNSSNVLTGGGFVVGGGNFRSDSLDNWIQRPVLYFFDAFGTAEGFVELGPENQEWIGRQAKQTPDGGYVICGETSALGGGDAFVIKTDAAGNEEWLRTYGGNGIDFGISVDNRPGGGYYMGGEYRSGSNDWNMWVLALNDTGGVVWEKIWGSPFDESYAHISTAADGHVLVASAWSVTTNFTGKKYLAKLDQADGSVIWERQYGSFCGGGCQLGVVKEVQPGGDLIAASWSRPQNVYHGTLLRTTSNGDSLWMRDYLYQDDLVNNGSGLFRDVEPTPDGGFIAVGSAFQAGPYTQDVWVVKVDSMGCIEPGCHLIQGMEAQVTNLRDALTVAPNPVAAGSIVQVSIDLPASFTPQGGLRLTVVSSEGRVVQEQRLGSVTPEDPRSGLSGVSPMTLALPALRAGLYHLHLSDATRWISGAKLVVE